ncbi:alpha-crystallin B chain [Rhagoletis pomonella]|uniref:alpha-crystallin B chain n=1 Tax=Rhagoletis pomonella TaxID=28610 RepID=UPI00177C0038|nr:alpha-crystallin B chain [Rhagoletis pomonella]
MPTHWDWDWDWPHDHFWHWPSTRLWPIDSFSYHARCPTSRRWKSTFGHHDIDVDVCARDWHIHHWSDDGPWCHRSCLASRVTIERGDEPDSLGKGTFKVVIDVHHFRDDELVLKVRNNDTIVLTGKQKDDRGEKSTFCITREFTRKYKLPRNYDATLAKATRSTDGILTIIVPAPPPLDDVERVVDIEPTGAYFGTTSNDADKNAKAIENGADNEEEEEAGDEPNAGERENSKKARFDSTGDSK